MRDRAVVEAEPLFRLLEIAADDVLELLELDMDVGVERVDVVHRDLPARHVPFVVPHPLIVFLDVRVGAIVLAEPGDVGLRILIANQLVGVEAQHLVRAYRPGDFGVDIGLDQLRPPIAVIAADEPGGRDVVQQAGEHHLLGQPALDRVPRALQQMHRRAEAVFEEIRSGSAFPASPAGAGRRPSAPLRSGASSGAPPYSGPAPRRRRPSDRGAT